jgi:hypothetical protein
VIDGARRTFRKNQRTGLDTKHFLLVLNLHPET